MRAEVIAWSREMEIVLRRHDPILGESWKESDRVTIHSALQYAVNSLNNAVGNNNIEKQLEQLVDISNLSMMMRHLIRPLPISGQGLTRRQHEALTFISDFIVAKNVSPSYRDIGKGLSMRSTSQVHGVVHGLIKRGFLTKGGAGGRRLRLKHQ